MPTFSITTPIYYVNDHPHIGHCYTTVVADAAARFQRLMGKEVFFLTGTDEHGVKVEKSAAAKGLTPQQLADANAEVFKQAVGVIGASNDDFIRTTEPRHTAQVQAAFRKLIDSGDIYLGTYEGWYDEGQEEYVTETQAKERDFKGFNGQPLVRAKEENYYFRLSAFQQRLEEFYAKNPGFVKPAARFNEVKGRLRDGLQDVPFSRTTFKWGIPVPGSPGHVVYVWMDALLNYCTALGLPDPAIGARHGVPPERRKFWPADVHVVGKEILWFHAVIWPAVLMAMGLPTPRCVYAHSFWVAEGRKMSKTLGNFIDLPTLRAYIDRYGLDAVRWYMLTQGPLDVTDADWSYAKFVEVYNADLANGIGNCASRVGNMIEKYFGGRLPVSPAGVGPDAWKAHAADPGAHYDWPAIVNGAAERAVAAAERFDLATAFAQGTEIVRQVDGFINATRPFTLAKRLEEPGMRGAVASILALCAEAIRVASLLLAPAMPGKMAELWRVWSCEPPRGVALAELTRWGGPHALRAGQIIAKGEPLFMRAEAKDPAPTAG